jgi:hypothetical protein
MTGRKLQDLTDDEMRDLVIYEVIIDTRSISREDLEKLYWEIRELKGSE